MNCFLCKSINLYKFIWCQHKTENTELFPIFDYYRCLKCGTITECRDGFYDEWQWADATKEEIERKYIFSSFLSKESPYYNKNLKKFKVRKIVLDVFNTNNHFCICKETIHNIYSTTHIDPNTNSYFIQKHCIICKNTFCERKAIR